jgi:hypothetical protein
MSIHSNITCEYFINEKTGHIGQGCVNLDCLGASHIKFLHQFNVGIVSSFEFYQVTNTDAKKEQLLWIHHFAILLLFHPCFHIYLNDKTKVKFLRQFTPDNLKSYVAISGNSPNYSYLWVGEGGHIG